MMRTATITLTLLLPWSLAVPLPAEAVPFASSTAAPAESRQGPAAQDSTPQQAQAPSVAEVEADDRYQQALTSMQAGDYAVAFCSLKPLAEAGHPQSQFSLGWMYHNGYGLSINNNKALSWWQRAAEQGHTSAAFALGLLLSNGDEDVNKDLPEAAHYFLQAAEQGHEDARMMLAHMVLENSATMTEVISQWQTRQWALVGKPIVVRVKRANLRSEPSLEGPISLVLEQDTRLIQLAEHQRWLQVILPERGITAWIYDSLVRTAIAEPEGLAISSPSRHHAEPVAPHAEDGTPLP